jgi:DNA-binding winged helix-turn-helix (wHTH) protein
MEPADISPFGRMELNDIARFGAFELNRRTGELRKSGVRVRLQDQPFQVLAALLEAPGQLVTREELQRRLWPDAVQGDFEQGLNKAVNKLRTALSDKAENPRFIETLSRRGYRFVAPVVFGGAPSARGGNPFPGSVSPAAPPLPAPVSMASSLEKPPEIKEIAGDLPPLAAPLPLAAEAPKLAAKAPPSSAPSAPPSSVPSAPRSSVPPASVSPRPPVSAPDSPQAASLPPNRRSAFPRWVTAGLVAPLAVAAALLLAGVVLAVLSGVDLFWKSGGPPRGVPDMQAGPGVVERWSVAESRFVPLQPPISGDGVRYSADGQWIVFVGYPSAQLFVMRRDGQALTALAPGVFERTYLPEWSPDGQQIAFAARKPDSPWKVYLIHRDGSGLRELHPGPGTEADPTFSPDGKRIAFAPFPWETQPLDTGIFVLNLETNAIQRLESSQGYFSPQWSPDGRFLAALTEGESKLALYDFETKSWTRLTGMPAIHPVWDRRGTALYFISEGKVQRFRPGANGSPGRVEPVLSIEGLPLRSNSPFGDRAAPWVGLGADDEVLLLRARAD